MDFKVVYVDIDGKKQVESDDDENVFRYQPEEMECASEEQQSSSTENKLTTIPLIDGVPEISGYYIRYSHLDAKCKTVDNLSKEENEKNLIRRTTWSNITQCPECGGTELFRFYSCADSRYYIRCDNVPAYVYKELDSLCTGVEFKPSARSKNQGIVPLSQNVKSVEEYVEKIQEKLCGWNVSL